MLASKMDKKTLILAIIISRSKCRMLPNFLTQIDNLFKRERRL